MSNIKLILLVVVAFFLLIFFGHSPMDEVRKKRAERAGRKLVEKIEEANKKKGGMPGIPNNFSAMQGGNGGVPNNYNNGPNPFQAANPYNQQQMNQTPAGQPATNGQPPVPTNQSPPSDSYYPPEPKNKQIKPPISSLPAPKDKLQAGANSKATVIAKKALANSNLITDDGKSLAFWGSRVYVYDDHGKLKPMPDGNYPMYDGKWTMTVRGGEQVIADGEGIQW